MSSRGKKWLVGFGSGVLIIALLAVGGWKVFVNTNTPKSFPQVDGEMHLAGLDGPVDVYRDTMGIPHIYATTTHDLFFAEGFVHAQDRFWQMDFWRHIGSGTLSEMFGAGRVDTDAFLRTLGWRQIAEQEWEELSAESQGILTAYSDGVNAYLADHQGSELSLEYAILGLLTPSYKPEQWTPIHSLTWAKAMAWDLRGNMDEEIARAILLKTLTPAQVEELFPPYPRDHPIVVNQLGSSASDPSGGAALESMDIPPTTFIAAQRNIALMSQVLGEKQGGIGSNNWVIGGSHTATGRPFLANDPHLSIQMPSIWYQVDMHCAPQTEDCPLEVAGFSFAGVPGVIIGHNDRIAWGFTNTGPDVMDLYIEKVNPDNPDQYEVNGAWVDFETRTEVLNTGGGEPVTITVRSTRHGPVISDTYGPLEDNPEPEATATPFKHRAGIELPEPYVIALRWTALEPNKLFEAVWGLDRAANFEDFREAAREFAVPAQNLVYADVDGNIGYQMPGNIPIRENGDGRYPVPGWNDDHEWKGYIPFDELPYLYNPPDDFISTANNQIPPNDYPYLVTSDWDYGFRAERIVQLIRDAPAKMDAAYLQGMQGDNLDLNAATLVPILMQIGLGSDLDSTREMLRGWDYQDDMDSQPAALFAVFWSNLLKLTFNDDLPEEYQFQGGDRGFEVVRRLVEQPGSSWWDNKESPTKVETRDDTFAAAFSAAVSELSQDYGRNQDNWPTWGELHGATFRNGSLGESGVPPIEKVFNRGPFEAGGGSSIVNATGWDASEGYEVATLPSMRFIADMSNLNNSLTVHTTGQSGHVDHPHYIDMADLWRNIQYYPMLWGQAEVTDSAESHLRLLP
jgi:penicillin amidase